MEFSSSEKPHPRITNQPSNPLQFTIHLPTSSPSANPSPGFIQNLGLNSGLGQNSDSNGNSLHENRINLAPIPRRRRCGRPRRPQSYPNQVKDLTFLSNTNETRALVGSLASSSGEFRKAQTEISNSLAVKKHGYGLNSGDVLGKKVVNDVSEEIIVINKEAMSEALVALTSGFPADSLTDEEIDAGVVSVVGGIEQVNYILIRNHIITRWRENVSTWITKEMFLDIIPNHCGGLLDSAYNYLVLQGYINFGVAPGIKERILVEPSKPHVIVVGAGLAGLAAARQLMTFGFKVTVLEGRKRAGGRVYTKKLEVGNRTAVADLGGSVLTGTLGNPLGILARQLSYTLHKVRDKCPIYSVDGRPVDPDLDRKVETSFNQLLDKVSKLRQMMGDVSQDVSLGAALETFWEAPGDSVNGEEMKLFHWHLANLEYANAGLLSKLSLAFWDQDDPFDMGGDHCFLPGGNGRLVQALAENVPILYEKTVQAIRYTSDGVQVAAGGQVYDGDMALCTVPLGVLKSGSIKFIPELPQRKLEGIKRLGFGLLNKVAMLFSHAFWGTDLDTFGHLSDDPSLQGEFFLFYSYATVAGGPILIALVAGEAAHKFETMEPTDAVTRVLLILKGIYEPQGIEVPEPIQTVCTRWGSDPFCLGSYSNVAVGASGDDYDIIAESVGDGRVFFAGEATTRRYPATMHGALLSGFREAANMAHYARVRASRLKVEKNPTRNAHSCASILADLFREPDIEFGSFSIIFGRKDFDSNAILRVTFGNQRKKPDLQHSNKLLFEQLQSHFNQRQEFHIYTLLSKQQALDLREVRGGDENRMNYLTEKLGVKLVGRKGLGPSADSVIASVKSERSRLKTPSSGILKSKVAAVKQNQIRKAKIVGSNRFSIPRANVGLKIARNGINEESRTLGNSDGFTSPCLDIQVGASSGNIDLARPITNNVSDFASDSSGSAPRHLGNNNGSGTDFGCNVGSSVLISNNHLDCLNANCGSMFDDNLNGSNPQNNGSQHCLTPSLCIDNNLSSPVLNVSTELLGETSGSNTQNLSYSDGSAVPPCSVVGTNSSRSGSPIPSNSHFISVESQDYVSDISDGIDGMSIPENIFEDIMNELLPPTGSSPGTWQVTGKF
ncbi:protein FLOWERINGUS D-like isoform X1 [Primulina huaijiensis]|uniref:protein FLOWERINGUS D-like isoform X1 n=2 Tax=Primulina huaijiensis TaxID=1492673 RepID=UPI003CC72CC8